MAWASMRDRMLNLTQSTFSDGLADYVGTGGAPAVTGVSVVIDRNLMQAGAEGMFRSDAVGVSWLKSAFAGAARGGVFTLSGESFIVDEIIADDGHSVTAACMVQP